MTSKIVEVVHLRERGLFFKDIGELLGLSKQRCHQIYTCYITGKDPLGVARKRYLSTPKGKATLKRYQVSPKGRATTNRYQKTYKYKVAQERYRSKKEKS